MFFVGFQFEFSHHVRDFDVGRAAFEEGPFFLGEVADAHVMIGQTT